MYLRYNSAVPILIVSVAKPDPGTGFVFTPGSGKDFFRMADLGFPTHISENLLPIFLGKKYGTIFCQIL